MLPSSSTIAHINQDWLAFAKRADNDALAASKMNELLVHIDPYDNKYMLPRCCAQFGYIEGLKALLLNSTNIDWDRVMAAAVMGGQKMCVELMLSQIDPSLSGQDKAGTWIPNQALRLAMESGQNEVLRLLIAVVPYDQRSLVLLWCLEEYNHAVRTQAPTDKWEGAVKVLYPTAAANKLLDKNSDLPMSSPGRLLLADLLSESAALVGEMSLNTALRKAQCLF